MEDVDIVVPTHRPGLFAELAFAIAPAAPRLLPGDSARSLAALFNACIETSPCETVIVACDKTRARYGDVEFALRLLDERFGLVALHGFRFFAARKDLFRAIGLFDETFEGGSFSDSDLLFRMAEANIAYFENRQVPFMDMLSSWSYETESKMRERFNARYAQSVVDGVRRVHRFEPSAFRRLAAPAGNWSSPGWLPWSRTKAHDGEREVDYASMVMSC